jgi:acyl-CoA synthetase (AMP-forming)/AMP-acid ligase II
VSDYAAHLAELREKWRAAWPAHLPAEPDYTYGRAPLAEYLRQWARRRPGHTCVNYYGRELTYAEVDRLSDAFAAFLLTRGCGGGTRVGLHLGNCPQFMIAFYGVLKAGAVHVPVNPMFKPAELTYELADAGVELLVTLDSLADVVRPALDGTRVRAVVVTALGEYLPAAPALPVPSGLAAGPPRPTAFEGVETRTFADALNAAPAVKPVTPRLDDLAALNYTGGTTGMPKGCEHTHGDMLYTAATATTYGSGNGPDDVSLIFIPVFWIAGENGGLLNPVFTGSTVVLLNRWDPDAVLEAVERYRVTGMVATVDNYVELMDRPDFAARDLTSLRYTAGMSFVRKLTPELRRRWADLPNTGGTLREGSYGMTETHTSDTITGGFQDDDHDLKSQPVFCGIPVPGTEVMILDFDTGEPKPPDAEGEIVIRTPSLTRGYWNKPDATAAAVRDGWLHTGDIGCLDGDGCLHFLGRAKEMLKVNGMSVFPSEIEVLLGRNDAVEGCGVIGVDDPRTGQRPRAYVVLRDGADGVDADAVTAWARANMATYKVPEVRIVDHLPLTATGKVIKHRLEKEFE